MHSLRVPRQSHKLVIQKMIEEDIEHVVLIERNSFSDPWSKQTFLDDLKNPLALPLVMKLDEKVVGYVSLWQVDRELHIGNVAVAEDHRRKGIGRLLMERVIEEGNKRECKSILLDVRESNRAAISLYEKLGFVALSKRGGYYHLPKEDALIMLKRL